MADPIARAIKELSKSWIETIHHPQGVGFLAHDEEIEHREVGPGSAEKEAIRILEGVIRYLTHDVGCGANDLDYLDHTPCTCGLRKLYNPKGLTDPTPAPMTLDLSSLSSEGGEK